MRLPVRRLAVAAAIVAVIAPAAPASAAMSASLLTWGVIGLDSNNVNTGPNQFPVGSRMCVSGTSATGVVARFVWDSANPYINVTGPATVSFGTVAAGRCVDAYVNVAVTRTAAAYFTARRFHFTWTSTNTAAASTPVRELYVEKLISQNRNEVISIVGPSTMVLGETYTITVTAETAPGGYEQVAAFFSLPTSIFRIDSVTTVASTGANVRQPYLDACRWDGNPSSPTYRECLATGKQGGTLTLTYVVTVIGTGSGTSTNAIYDFSGSSYHYNTDWNTAPNLFTWNAVAPDLTVVKGHTGTFTRGGTGTYTLTVRNVGTGPTTRPITLVDTLPTGLTYVSASGGGFSCSASGQRVTCTRTTALAVGASATVTLTVRIAATAPTTLTNLATVTTPNDVVPGNNTDTDTVSLPPLTSPTPTGSPTVGPNPTSSPTVGPNPTSSPTVGPGTPGTGGSGGTWSPGPANPRPGIPTGQLPLTGGQVVGMVNSALRLVDLGAVLLLLAALSRRREHLR